VQAIVVDDSRAMRMLMGRVLKDIGFVVDEAGDGSEALELLRAASAAESDAIKCRIGELLNESHTSLRELYEVSTNEVERLREHIIASPGVFGARLMGGGFGGNVLALVNVDAVKELLERVQAGYYGPGGREAATEGAIMVSTAGDGLSLNNEPMV